MSTSRAALVGILALALAVILSDVAVAAPTVAAHLEGGFGSTDVRPLTSPTTLGETVSLGLGLPIRGRMRANVELTATLGGLFAGKQIPEGPFSGDRSLTTFLAGIEASDPRDGRGLFAGVGLGLGHATLSNATSRDFLSPHWRYPNRNFLGFAFGGGLGYRTHGGPGPLGIVLACRYHGVLRSGRMGASAFALTTGVAY